MASSTPSSPKHSQSSSSSSPEFEFWGRRVVGTTTTTNNPNTLHSSADDLPSADELFSDGILLPLQTLTLTISTSSSDNATELTSDNAFSSSSSSPSPGPASKRWKDIFMKAGERERRKDKTRLSVGNNAELNINIWPFSRSRSAGNASSIGSWSSRGNKLLAKHVAARNVSSAPCSRSNSRNGDSAGPDGAQITSSTASSIIKRWAQTGRLGPSGSGIRVGRAGPVWQLRRKKHQQQLPQQEGGEGDRRDGICGNAGVKMLNLNVNTCIGYRNYQASSCSDVSAAGTGADGVGAGTGNSDDPAPPIHHAFSLDRYAHSMRHLLEAELRRCGSRQLIRSRSRNALIKISSLIKLDFLLLSCSPSSVNKKSRSRNPLKKNPAAPPSFWKKRGGAAEQEKKGENVRVKDIVKLRSFSLPPASPPSPTVSSSSSSTSWSESEFNGSDFLVSSNGSSEFMPDVIADKCSPVRTEASRAGSARNNKADRSESSTAGSCNSEEEEKDQLSPVSIMDFPYEEEEEEDVQTEEEEESSSDSSAFHANLAVIERAKQALLQKLRRFESLAELVPVDLNSQFSDADDEECSRHPASDDDDDIDEEEVTTEMQAWKLLDHIKSSSSVRIEGYSEKLLVEFLLEGLNCIPQIDSFASAKLVNAARRWVEGESDCWEQRERRVEIEVEQMEWNGQWRCFEEEKQELAACLGNGVMGSLMDELVRELVVC